MPEQKNDRQTKRAKSYRLWIEIDRDVKEALDRQAKVERRSTKAQAEYLLSRTVRQPQIS